MKPQIDELQKKLNGLKKELQNLISACNDISNAIEIRAFRAPSIDEYSSIYDCNFSGRLRNALRWFENVGSLLSHPIEYFPTLHNIGELSLNELVSFLDEHNLVLRECNMNNVNERDLRKRYYVKGKNKINMIVQDYNYRHFSIEKP